MDSNDPQTNVYAAPAASSTPHRARETWSYSLIGKQFAAVLGRDWVAALLGIGVVPALCVFHLPWLDSQFPHGLSLLVGYGLSALVVGGQTRITIELLRAQSTSLLRLWQLAPKAPELFLVAELPLVMAALPSMLLNSETGELPVDPRSPPFALAIAATSLLALFASFRLILAPYAIADGMSLSEAVRHSWTRTGAQWWRYLLLLGVIVLLPRTLLAVTYVPTDLGMEQLLWNVPLVMLDSIAFGVVYCAAQQPAKHSPVPLSTEPHT